MRQNWWRGLDCWGEVTRPAGWGTQPLRIQLRLLTFQFSCLPYLGATCRPSGAKYTNTSAIVGARFPRPAGWGTQPLRMQLRLLTFQFSCLLYLGATCRPSGAKYTNMSAIVGARLPRPTGWGTQPLRIQLRLLTFQFSGLPYPAITCRPAGALLYLVYAGCYKPVAPLGLNAAELAARYPSWGRGFLAQWVGEPNPYGCSFDCSRSNFCASRILVRPVAPLW